MRQDIYEEIIEPLDGYLNGYLTEKEIEWSELRWCARRIRNDGGFWDVRAALTPYYVSLLMADKSFFRNGNTDSMAKKSLLDLFEGEGRFAGRILSDVDIVQAAEKWAEQLMPDNHDPGFFLWMLKAMLEHDYKTDWKSVYDTLKVKLAKAQHSGNFKLSEMHCLLMGVTLIELTDHPREKKNELFGQLRMNWGFIKYMYSVLIRYIVGMRVENFAALAGTACNRKASHPYMHLFYKAFKSKCDTLCPPEMIDPRSGESVRVQAERHLQKMEQIIKTTPQSDGLNELCGILFPKVMEEVLRQSRPKTYEELEVAVDDLTNRYNKVLEQLTLAVKDVESDKISADDLTAAFLRFPTQLALSFFGSMSTLLAMNATWQKYAPMIQEQILAKQEEDRIFVNGDYVLEKRVDHAVEHVEAGGTGISINGKEIQK
ncbi:MAG: hypothetical protein IJ845_08020 [Bacteroidaceae bacterium]|nr:hypothetical protein [Bacteroidaceae bacterium]